MKPRFAEAIDPILLHCFALFERIDSGEDIEPLQERVAIERLIRDADEQLADQSEEWEHAKYALIAWVDEMLVVAHDWPGQEVWRENVLEWSLRGTRQCFDLYYVNATNALNGNADDALQMIYVCVMLGFRGLYRDPDQNRALLERHSLPDGLHEWTGQYGTVVRDARQRWNESTAGQRCERTLVTATPLSKRMNLVWPWLLAVILLGLNILF